MYVTAAEQFGLDLSDASLGYVQSVVYGNEYVYPVLGVEIVVNLLYIADLVAVHEYWAGLYYLSYVVKLHIVAVSLVNEVHALEEVYQQIDDEQ